MKRFMIVIAALVIGGGWTFNQERQAAAARHPEATRQSTVRPAPPPQAVPAPAPAALAAAQTPPTIDAEVEDGHLVLFTPGRLTQWRPLEVTINSYWTYYIREASLSRTFCVALGAIEVDPDSFYGRDRRSRPPGPTPAERILGLEITTGDQHGDPKLSYRRIPVTFHQTALFTLSPEQAASCRNK